MEIVFRSPAWPQSLLNLDNSLAQRPSETLCALLCAIRDAVATNLEENHRSLVLGYLKALVLQESYFRSTLRELTYNWIPTRKEEQIIQATCHRHYPVGVIEGDFYQYGGLYGIVALVIVFRGTYSILNQWATIKLVAPAQQWLVSNVSQLFSSRENRWIKHFIPEEPHNRYPLQYLGHHAYKRKSVYEQQEKHDVELASCQQPPTPTSIPSPLQHFQSRHGVPSPRFIASPPVQDLPQQLQVKIREHTPQSRTGNSAKVDLQGTHHLPASFFPSPYSSPYSSPYKLKSPGSMRTIDNDDPRYSLSFPANNDLPSTLISDRSDISTESHRLAHILNTEDGSHLLAPARRTLLYPQHQTELVIISQQLDDNSRDLATLLVSLGDADIPKSMLLRAAMPKYFFSRSGELDFAPAPNLNPLLACSQSLDSVLGHLEALALIRNSVALGSITVLPKLRSLVKCTLGDTRRVMEYKASLLVFHSFPEDPDTDPADRVDGFVELCKSQLPHIDHVLKSFQAPEFINQFSAQERKRIVCSCLSASGFGRLDRKLNVLAAAERIMEVSEADSLLSAKLRFRKFVLYHLYPAQIKDAYPYNINFGLSSADSSSNAFLAENILFNVQLMIYRDELSRAWHELQNMTSLDASRSEERRALQKKICFQIKICLFAGEFLSAKQLLAQLNKLSPISQSLQPLYFSYLVSANCEYEDIDAATEGIPTCDFVGQSWLNLSVKERRTSLAAAGRHLMNGLWILKNGKEFGEVVPSLLKAKAIYEAINKVYLKIPNAGLALAIRKFSVSAGLAMIAHLEWRFTTTVKGETALSYWRTALNVGEETVRSLGGKSFPQMIVSYTICDITSQLGLLDETTKYIKTAKLLYQRTGRQFHYFALGSIWFDMVQGWNETNGLSQISELSYKDYMTEQRKSGFPYEENSVRLCK